MASSSRPARARYLSSIVPTSLIPEKSGNHSECSSYFCWGPQPVSPQFGDQTGGLVGSASGLPVLRGRGVEQLGLEVAVAEAGDGELAGEHGDEQQDGVRVDRMEARHPGSVAVPAAAQ